MSDDPHDAFLPPIYGTRGEEWQTEADIPPRSGVVRVAVVLFVLACLAMWLL